MRNGHMLARAVSIRVKPGCRAELTRILKQDVIPLFRSEADFMGLLAFIRADGSEALSLSLWDKEEKAEANCPTSLSELTVLAGVVQGSPSVQVYSVSKSTYQKMKKVLGQGKNGETNPDLEVYQACAAACSIVTHTVHSGLRFPSRPASYEFDKTGNPILCRPNGTKTRREKQFKIESHASGGEDCTSGSVRPGTFTQS
jgi:hypothetical protein